MNWLKYLIHKYLVIKEIWSQEGELHFRRYRLLATPWFNVYIHEIRQSDMDAHMHDHPFSFKSLILSGSYFEQTALYPNFIVLHYRSFASGDIIKHHACDVHKLTLKSPMVWTLVITSGRERVWGYRLDDGSWVDFKTYRQLKRAGQLPK
jgi:hypothetical protein